jgi:hypothetical protein
VLAGTRHSLRPLIFEGKSFLQTSGVMRRENAQPYSAVIVREGGRSSIPEMPVMEPIGCGVLDTRLPGMTICFAAIASLRSL